MARTDNLRRQLSHIHGLVAQVDSAILGANDRAGAVAIAMALARLTGTLRIHYVQTDQSLYPQMIASSERATSVAAATFHAHVEDLATIYSQFAERWQTVGNILGDYAIFQQHWSEIRDLLVMRMTREIAEMLPMADAMAEARAA